MSFQKGGVLIKGSLKMFFYINKQNFGGEIDINPLPHAGKNKSDFFFQKGVGG